MLKQAQERELKLTTELNDVRQEIQMVQFQAKKAEEIPALNKHIEVLQTQLD
jgi:hypothetical protein